MRFAGKYISILGDSVSTLWGYTEPNEHAFYTFRNKEKSRVYYPEDTWWGQVIDALSARLLVNHSVSGSKVIRHPACEIESYGCSDARTSALSRDGILPDAILVYLGTNDWGGAARVYPEAGEENDLAVFSVAYREMLRKLRENYPEAEIICITPSVCRWSIYPEYEFPYTYSGRHISEYCEAIAAVGGEEFGCRVIDLVKNSEPYDTFDGWHPNAEGMQTLAKKILRGLK